ncbi:hypothetical protein RB195_009501 [Necator americanus]|uniref:Uncharacterized protein n=1 Tax=Necator americanus TaxID=51031 RepID=A0ABR1CU49_NECAM
MPELANVNKGRDVDEHTGILDIQFKRGVIVSLNSEQRRRAENAEMKKELEEIRSELLERRRRSIAKNLLEVNQSGVETEKMVGSMLTPSSAAFLIANSVQPS